MVVRLGVDNCVVILCHCDSLHLDDDFGTSSVDINVNDDSAPATRPGHTHATYGEGAYERGRDV